MANIENLKPKTTLSKEEAKELGRRGGIASGEARRKKKRIKEQLELLLSLPQNESKHKKTLRAMGIPEEDLDNKMLMVYGQFMEAVSGNTKAFENIMEIIGEGKQEKELKESRITIINDLPKGDNDE